MASIPLPALAVNNQQQSPIEQYGKMLSLQQMLGQQKTQQLQQTALGQENQQRQIELDAQQKMQAISPKHVQKDDKGNVTGFDFGGFMNEAASAGVPPQILTKIGQQQAQYTEAASKATAAQRANVDAANKAAYETLEGIRSEPDIAKRSALLQAAAPNLQKHGFDLSQIPPSAKLDDATLDHVEATLGMHTQVLADAETAAKTNEQNQKANLEKMEAEEKGSPLTKMENDPTMMAGDKLPASMAYLQSKVSDSDPSVAARATRLLSTAKVAQKNQLAMEASKKATDQAIADGDPNAAAKLLVDGTVAPSQLISSRKPEFAQKAFTAAARMQPGWNAQSAEGNFKVASSPAQVAFFGSAKSLTDKGGTLDQLEAIGKEIPQNQIPALNTIADWTKAAMGKGPVAKYAAVNLGVADDYAKVMGGGSATDTGRLEGLNLAPMKASPEARHAAIEGIRGAVGSQTNSRIGSNPVLKKMYGGDSGGGSNAAEHVAGGKSNGFTEGQTGTGSDGKKYVVKGGVWVSAQ